MDTLTPEHIGRLALLYEEMGARNDARDLSVWLRDYPDDDKASSTGIYWPIYRLFWVFSDLMKRGVPPFASGRVTYDEPDPIFDWTKLPPELRYLGQIAEKWGRYHGDDSVEALDEEQLIELAAASERIRLRGDAPAIFAWFKRHHLEYPEGAWLAFAITLMEEAGVSIED